MTTSIQKEYLPLAQTMPLFNPKYPKQYYDNFVELKKMMQNKVFNKRANQLAQQLIPYGETNYNLWYVKKMCYLNKIVTFEHEMQFSEETLFDKVKNFQLWQHRRFLLQHQNNLNQYMNEYSLIDVILQTEPKNYHAWSQRVWIVEQVKNYQEELIFTENQIKKDVMNNSVWAYRQFIVGKLIQGEVEKGKLIEREIITCIGIININANNIAAWNYLRGYLPSIKLSDIPSTNTHLTKLPIPQHIISLILDFAKSKLTEINLQVQQGKLLLLHHRIQEQIQLLTTLVTIFSQTQQNKQFAKNVLYRIYIQLERASFGLKRKTKTILLEVGGLAFVMLVFLLYVIYAFQNQYTSLIISQLILHNNKSQLTQTNT